MATHSSILAWRIPMDRGAWRATVYSVTKGQTRLFEKDLSTESGSLTRNQTRAPCVGSMES